MNCICQIQPAPERRRRRPTSSVLKAVSRGRDGEGGLQVCTRFLLRVKLADAVATLDIRSVKHVIVTFHTLANADKTVLDELKCWAVGRRRPSACRWTTHAHEVRTVIWGFSGCYGDSLYVLLVYWSRILNKILVTGDVSLSRGSVASLFHTTQQS